jgi:tetratricopeptide (TPR) repeat protein
MAEAGEESRWTAYTWYELGRLHVQRGRIAAARETLEQARDRYRTLAERTGEAEDGLGEALPLYALGYIAVEYGRTREAESYFERAIEIFERAGDARANDLVHLLGLVALDRGDVETAEKQFLRSAAHSEAIGDRRYLGEDRLQLALIDHLSESLESADEGYRCAATHLEAVGHQQVLIVCLSMHAALMAKQGRVEEARARIEAACRLLDLPEGSPVRVSCEACGAVVSVAEARAQEEPRCRTDGIEAARAVLQSLHAPREDGDEDGTAWISSSHMVRQAAGLLERMLGEE